MNDRESVLTDELLRAQHKMAEMYRKHQALDQRSHELSLRLNELSHGQGYSISGKSALVNDHAIDLHIQETLRLRRKRPIWLLKAWLLSLKIRRLRLFDFQWYLDRYPDIGKSGIRPFKHFLMHGIFEGRDPSPRFNTKIYLSECLHILNPGEPAFFHYLTQGRAAGIPASTTAVYPGTRLIATKIAAIEDQMAAIQEQLLEQSASLAKSEEAIKGLKSHITATERAIKDSSSNDADQLGKLIGIQNYLIHGEKPLPFRGWPISPDLGLLLIDLISRNKYDLIIEFGSGTSTVLMSKIIAGLLTDDATVSGTANPQVVAFEHLHSYYEKTMSLVKQESLQHIARVCHTPLEVYGKRNGTTVSYYSCQKVLSELSREFPLGESGRILVLVDGPPEATNKMARLPAFDVLTSHFPLSSIEFVLDDYRRPDEKLIVETWRMECYKAGVPFSFEEIQTEKGCAIFRYRG